MRLDNLYNNLFLNCQTTGKYRVFTFDIKNSKKMDKRSRYIGQYELITLAERIYSDIKELEKVLKRKILLNEEGYGHFFDTSVQNDFAFKYEPFIYGDMMGFTIYNGSLDSEIIYKIFEKNKRELNIQFDFNINSGVYETDNYGLGTELCFRGYCIQIVSNLHKPENKKLKEKLEKINVCNKLPASNLEDYIKLVDINHDKAVKNANKILLQASIINKNEEYNIQDSEVKYKYRK